MSVKAKFEQFIRDASQQYDAKSAKSYQQNVRDLISSVNLRKCVEREKGRDRVGRLLCSNTVVKIEVLGSPHSGLVMCAIEGNIDVNEFSTDVIKEVKDKKDRVVTIIDMRENLRAFPNLEVFQVLERAELHPIVEEMRRNCEEDGVRTRRAEELQVELRAQVEADIKRMMDEGVRRAEIRFSVEYKAMQEKERESSDLKKVQKTLEDEIEQGTVIGIITQTVNNAISFIRSDLKDAAQGNLQIVQKLKETVVLAETNEEITNPFDNNNMAGMFQVLVNNYAKPSISGFNVDLDETLSCVVSMEDFSKDPMCAVARVEEFLTIWISMGYWSYMTIDIFFTRVLIKAMPRCALRDACITEMLDYDEAQEKAFFLSDKAGSSVPDGGMQRFRHLVSFINTRKKGGLFTTQTGNADGGSGGGHGGGGKASGDGGGKLRGSATPFQYKGNTENAHDAEIIPSVGKEIIDPKTGATVTYSATDSRCEACATRSDKKHTPMCFVQSCHRCGKYGHQIRMCQEELKKKGGGKGGY